MAAPAGNQNAAKGKLWASAIRRALARSAEGSIDRGIDKLADKVVKAAGKGDLWALQEIGNRLDGKPAQAIIGGGEDDPPVRIARIERVIIDAKARAEDGEGLPSAT